LGSAAWLEAVNDSSMTDPAFPNLLAKNHRVTSSASADYNCVAWAAHDVSHWWQPGIYWPCDSSPGNFGATILEQAFVAMGYEKCDNGRMEIGFEKLAAYSSGMFYTHVARQLPSGRWTSKLGRDVDIEHESPEDVAGGVYGHVGSFLRRPLEGA
jgi:hypothetical protein